MPKIEIEFADVIQILSKKLRDDPELYYSWQSNIAMAVVDSFEKEENYELIHKAANDGAKRFLNILCNIDQNNRVYLKKPHVVLKNEDF